MPRGLKFLILPLIRDDSLLAISYELADVVKKLVFSLHPVFTNVLFFSASPTVIMKSIRQRTTTLICVPLTAVSFGAFLTVNALSQPSTQLVQTQNISTEDNFVQHSISITELQKLAVAQHPELARLHFNIQAAHGDWTQVGLYPNPELSFAALELGNEKKWGQQEVGITQEIVTSNKLALNRKVARNEWDAEKKKLVARQLGIQNEVKIKAYEVLAAQKTVALKQRLLKITNDALDAAEKMQTAREISVVELMQARIKRNQAALELQTETNNERLSWKRLAIAVGLPELQRQPISDSFTDIAGYEIDWEATWSRLVEASPELQIAINEIKIAQSVAQREQAARKPNFAVNATFGNDTTTNNAYGSVGLSVPLQIFNRNQGNIRKSLAEVSAANRQYQVELLDMQEKFSEIYNLYENASQSVSMLRDTIIPDVEKDIGQCLKGYRLGEQSYLELLAAQESMLETESEYIKNQKDLATAIVMIEGLLVGNDRK